MDLIVDSRLISLNSKDAQKLNGDYNSSCFFHIPNIVNAEDDIEYIECALEDGEIPVSWFLINDTNNILHYRYNSIDTSITLTKGNYNGSNLITEMENKFNDNGLTVTIVLSQITGKYTFKFSNPITPITFYYNLSPLLMKLLGFTETVSGVALTTPNPLNLLGILKLNICSSALAPLYSFSSNNQLSNQIIQTIAVNMPSWHQLTYINKSAHFNRLKSKIINNIDIQIFDDNGNFVEFNDIDWAMTIQLKIYKRINSKIEKIENGLKPLEKNENVKDEKENEDKEEINDLDILTEKVKK